MRAAVFSHRPLHQSMHSPFNGLDCEQTMKAYNKSLRDSVVSSAWPCQADSTCVNVRSTPKGPRVAASEQRASTGR